MKTKQLTKDLFWVGNLDPDLRVFDIIMHTEFGTTYNSYILKGLEKTVLFETSKAKCFDEYIEKVKEITPIEKIAYLVLDHTEPDHSGSVEKLLEINPKIKLVGSATAINFIKEICNRDFISVPVKDGDTISLGDKKLRFIAAPNLHWPDSIYTYIIEDKALVTCDSFGAHYSCEGVTNDKIENKEDYMKALKYYFDNIIGPFKPFMLKAINKIKGLDIELICPGHGPVLTSEPKKIIKMCKEWSTTVNPNTKKTVVIPYVSAYGYTGMLADKITEGIKEAGDIDVRLYDMVTADPDVVMEDIAFADGILLGTPTIVGEALKPIWDLTTSMFAGVHGGKIASAFGSYGWSGEGVPHMMERLGQLRMKLYGNGFKVRFKPSEAQLSDAHDFGYGFGASVIAGEIVTPELPDKDAVWKCLVCGEVIQGAAPPDACPVCGVGPAQFVKVAAEIVTFKKDSNEKFIIIGNGAAGTSACEEIRKRNATCGIEMISRENIIGYNRPMLTKGILAEVDTLNFYIKQFDWFKENNITLTLGVEVNEIDDKAKTVKLSDGSERVYDKLILATGAESFVPPIPGASKEGVFAIRRLETINKIRDYLDSGVKNAAVIGGGVLGLEAAWELKKAGLGVTVIEAGPVIMGRQLDEKAGQFLLTAFDKAGVKYAVGSGIEEIAGDEKATGVKLADGNLIPADIVIISTGVKQNIALAQGIGIETTRSIVVNDKMETGKEDIYACGDCAEFEGVNYAIWPQATDMGKVAGANAAGDEMIYKKTIPAVTFNGINTSIFSIGDVGKSEDKKYKTKEYCDEESQIYEKLYFFNSRFCGGILVGDTTKSGVLLKAIEEKTLVSDM